MCRWSVWHVYVFGSGWGGRYWGWVGDMIRCGFTNSGGTWGKWDNGMCVGCGGVGDVGGEWVGGLGQGLGGWSGVMSLCAMSLYYMCWWQVQVSVYCARQISAHLRCTQYPIMLHLIDICFLTCLCMWQISQIQTCLRVADGPGLVSTSPAFLRSITNYPAGSYDSLAQKTVIGPPLLGGGRSQHNVHKVCQTAVTAPPRVGCVVWSQPSASVCLWSR